MGSDYALVIAVLVVLASAGLRAAPVDQYAGISSLPGPVTTPAAVSSEGGNQVAAQPDSEMLPEPAEPATAPSDERLEAINIAEAMDGPLLTPAHDLSREVPR